MARKNENRKVKQKFVPYATIEKEGIRRELRVANILTENGYKVSVPLGSLRYDLIAEKYPKYIRVQVKNLNYEYEKDINEPMSLDQWKVNAYTTPNGKKKIYTKKDVDVIFAINLDMDIYAIMPVEEIPKSGVIKLSEHKTCKRRRFLNSLEAIK